MMVDAGSGMVEAGSKKRDAGSWMQDARCEGNAGAFLPQKA
jgi:hypothetical protein